MPPIIDNAFLDFIEELEQDSSLLEPRRFRQRVDALDRLDAYSSGWQASSFADPTAGAALHQRAKTTCARLEAVNSRLFESIRRDLRRGAGRDSLLPWVPNTVTATNLLHCHGYDYLDELISGVLFSREPSAEPLPLQAEMVSYQPTPARHIFDLMHRSALDERDFLIDLGSGLGHVSLLVRICTGAACLGIEIDPAYVDAARKSARALDLNNVTFIQGDARNADLSRGTVFYLYTPFSGAILRDVLDALRHEALSREIRICTLGPCTAVVIEEKWLNLLGDPHPDRITIFRSRS